MEHKEKEQADQKASSNPLPPESNQPPVGGSKKRRREKKAAPEVPKPEAETQKAPPEPSQLPLRRSRRKKRRGEPSASLGAAPAVIVPETEAQSVPIPVIPAGQRYVPWPTGFGHS